MVHLFSPNGKYDSLYMRNYATLKVKDELARLPGVGQIQIFGSGEYAMRVWLDPNKVAARGLTASDVVTAMQEQNVQVSAGQLGAEPLPKASDFLISINAQGHAQRRRVRQHHPENRPGRLAGPCATWRVSSWVQAAMPCAPS